MGAQSSGRLSLSSIRFRVGENGKLFFSPIYIPPQNLVNKLITSGVIKGRYPENNISLIIKPHI